MVISIGYQTLSFFCSGSIELEFSAIRPGLVIWETDFRYQARGKRFPDQHEATHPQMLVKELRLGVVF